LFGRSCCCLAIRRRYPGDTMSGESWKWYSKGAAIAAGAAVPYLTAPWPVDNLFQMGPLSKKLVTHPLGALFVGSTQVMGAYVGAEFVDKTILGGASARTLEVITRGKYKAPESAWTNSPKSRLGRLHTHGYQVKPSDRMRKNKPLRTSSEWWAHYDSRHQHS